MSTNNNPIKITLTGNQVHGRCDSYLVVYDGDGNWLYDLPDWTEQLALDADGTAYNVICGYDDIPVMVLDELGNNIIDSVDIEEA